MQHREEGKRRAGAESAHGASVVGGHFRRKAGSWQRVLVHQQFRVAECQSAPELLLAGQRTSIAREQLKIWRPLHDLAFRAKHAERTTRGAKGEGKGEAQAAATWLACSSRVGGMGAQHTQHNARSNKHLARVRSAYQALLGPSPGPQYACRPASQAKLSNPEKKTTIAPWTVMTDRTTS